MDVCVMSNWVVDLCFYLGAGGGVLEWTGGVGGRGSDLTPQERFDGQGQVFLLEDLGYEICGAVIGVKKTFCCGKKGECGWKTHKHQARSNALYLKSTRGSCAANVTPCASYDVARLFMDKIKALETQKEVPPSVWLTVMTALMDVEKAEKTMEPGPLRAVTDNADDVMDGLIERFGGGGDGEGGEAASVAGLLTSPVGKMMSKRLWKEKQRIGQLKKQHVDELGQMDALVAELQEECRSVGNRLVQTNLDVKMLAATQGEGLEGAPPLSTEVGNVMVRVNGLEHRLTNAEKVTNDNKKSCEGHEDRLYFWDNDVKFVFEGDDCDWERVKKPCTDNRRFIKEHQGQLEEHSKELKDLARAGRAHGRGQATRGSFSADGGSETGGREAARGGGGAALTLDDLKAPMAEMIEQQVRKMGVGAGREMDGGKSEFLSVNNGRWKFSGIGGVSDWLEKSGVLVGEDSFGFDLSSLGIDAVKYMEMAADAGLKTRPEHEREEIHHRKTGKSVEETVWGAAVQSKFPNCFGSKSSTAGSSHSKIDTFEKFNSGDGVGGLYNELTHALEEVKATEIIRLNEDLRQYPELLSVAVYLTESAITFLLDYLRWMDVNYRNMGTNMSASTSQELAAVWKVQLTMSASMWEALWEPRRDQKHAHTLPRRRALLTTFHASLRTHLLMKEFMRTRFTEHPKIFPKLMSHMFKTHTPRADLLAVKKQLTEARDQLTSYKRKCDDLERRLVTLERAAGAGGGGGG